MKAETTRYRRERWETPDGKGLIAPLPAGIVGGCGPHLIRLVLMLHFQGQMTCERIVALLTGLGLMISKRQVVRLLTAKLEDFRAEDEAVLRAGLRSAPFVTVDDTGARHAGKSCFTTHIGSHRFTAFRTGPGKSRLALLGRLLGGAARYVINAAAIASMRGADLPQDIIANLAGHSSLAFDLHEQWMSHLRALGIADLRVTPDPVRVTSEAALTGAIEAEGLLGQAVIISDDAGQFRVGDHALCWVHAERLVHKLVPANDKQSNAVKVAKRMIWWPSALKGLQARPERATSKPPARAIQSHLQAPHRLCDARPPAQAPPRAQRRTSARARKSGNPAQHQRLGKRHPRLRHQAQNLRRNRQRKGPPSPRRHARPRQDLQETQNPLLRLSRCPSRHPWPRHPQPRDPRHPRPKLTNRPRICPGYWGSA